MSKLKICFVAPHAYPLFNKQVKAFFGGAEVRAWLLANGLAGCDDNDICFVVFDHGQRQREDYNGVRVYKLSVPLVDRLRNRVKVLLGFGRSMRTSGIRTAGEALREDRWTIYDRIDADAYCGFGVGDFTAELADFCKYRKKRFVLFSTSDYDFSEAYYSGSKEKNMYGSTGELCCRAIADASLIVTQTSTQKALLKERFGRDSVVIPSPVELENRVPSPCKTEGRKTTLWIGKSDRVKSPHFLVKLATSFPDVRFIMVLNRSQADVFDQIARECPTNMEIIERIPFHDTEALFAKAHVLINTSLFEGFPNTFLTAGKYGIPILSLQVDPDQFIEKHGCGIVAHGDPDALSKGLQRLVSDHELWMEYSSNITRYVKEHHDLRLQAARVNETMRRVTGFEVTSGRDDLSNAMALSLLRRDADNT